MTMHFIYKQIQNKETGDIDELIVIEADKNEKRAASIVKLYNLQVPKDLKDKVSYSYFSASMI